MKTVGPKSLVRAIIENPWSSVQDGLLLSSVMLVATLLALQYDLFWFVSVLSEPQRKISLAEATDLAMYRAKGQDRPSLVFSKPDASHPRQIA